MKSGFWQIEISEQDRYKTTSVIPFGQYEWNVMPFRLKNAPSEFQRTVEPPYSDTLYKNNLHIIIKNYSPNLGQL